MLWIEKTYKIIKVLYYFCQLNVNKLSGSFWFLIVFTETCRFLEFLVNLCSIHSTIESILCITYYYKLWRENSMFWFKFLNWNYWNYASTSLLYLLNLFTHFVWICFVELEIFYFIQLNIAFTIKDDSDHSSLFIFLMVVNDRWRSRLHFCKEFFISTIATLYN